MGITRNCSKFLLFAKSKGASYTRPIMLGRQVLYVTYEEFLSQFNQFDIVPIPLVGTSFEKYAEPLFKMLGAEMVESIDYSDFEGASVIADLNQPISDSCHEKYSVVFDGGTLEHVFNFPQAIKNCMNMLEVGGHFISITPANNQFGHGFYQFSPELFFSVFSDQHGFTTEMIAVGAQNSNEEITDWYEIAEPKKVKKRITLTNSTPTFLMIIAKKIRSTNDVLLQPMQSDYELVWNVYDSIKKDEPLKNDHPLLHYYRKYAPSILKELIRKTIGKSSQSKIVDSDLGKLEASFFKKIEI